MPMPMTASDNDLLPRWLRFLREEVGSWFALIPDLGRILAEG